MSASAQSRRASQDAARADLYARLQARRPEIEGAVLTRIYAVSDPSEAADPTYTEALRAAVPAALEYGLAALAHGEDRTPALPAALLAQARLAARNGVSLDTVLRRYFAGYALLGDFLIQEADDGGLLEGGALKQLLRTQATLFDRLIATVSDEYTRESGGHSDSAEECRAERIQRLLDGELLDTGELRYDFEACHIGVIAAGPGVEEAIRDLAKALDRHRLLVHCGEGTVWAWLGGRRELAPDDLERVLSRSWPTDLSLALGEPARGLAGWRLTHRQARAALPIALRAPQAFIHYADVALLASILQDDLLATSLCQLYLAPLSRERDGGETLRQTLRAYFTAERNASSAAVTLGVTRQTVVNRLRAVEERLDRPLGSCASEVEAALRLEDLGYSLLPFAAF